MSEREAVRDIRSARARTELKDKIKLRDREKRKQEKLEEKERRIQWQNSADGADLCKQNDNLNGVTHFHFYDDEANRKGHEDVFAALDDVDSPTRPAPKDKKLVNKVAATSAGSNMFRLFAKKPDPTINDTILKDRFTEEVGSMMNKGPSAGNPFHRTDEYELEKFKDDDSDKPPEERVEGMFGGLFSSPVTTPPRGSAAAAKKDLLVSPDKKIVVNKEKYFQSAKHKTALGTTTTPSFSSSFLGASFMGGGGQLRSNSSSPDRPDIRPNSGTFRPNSSPSKTKKKKKLTAEELKKQQVRWYPPLGSV